ncbi:hypothetical protein DN523_21205 [Burkholderia multivorans]|nr:hypothetical protein BURMUCGD1_4215 [Burkholderia multivorans CGD1]PRD80086.1 hypothetical protein C6P74_11870 [Burkholderia multivorans]PRE93082.1 hypothetical protein C6Q02_02150 [Burkholderia multivorans]PRH23425.1 hypothetical protein C6T71_16640 [Burkholderia multivorans]PRH47144.1 hypothetical protein C6V05_18395 [Burkholderia multivorans]
MCHGSLLARGAAAGATVTSATHARSPPPRVARDSGEFGNGGNARRRAWRDRSDGARRRTGER